MTHPAYKRPSRFIRRNYANVVATLALFVALTGVGLVKAGVLVTGAQIKNGTITFQDIRRNGIKAKNVGKNAITSADIRTGAVRTADIGEGQVTPESVTMPDPSQIKFNGTAMIEPPKGALSFEKIVDLGSYVKQDAESTLEITWTGSVEGRNGGEVSGCVFQLRIDGSPAPNGGGEVFGLNMVSVSASALFPGLGIGPHTVEVWAKVNVDTTGNRCVIGPEKAAVGQTVVAHEVVF